jgi:hypothetical protein
MNGTIDWSTGKIAVWANRTGLIEVEIKSNIYILEFDWYVKHCIEDNFIIELELDDVSCYNKDTGENSESLSDIYQETITEMVEQYINDNAYELGLESYSEDRYDFD